MRVEALVVVSGKEKTDDDTRENEPCSAIVSLVGNKHRLPSTALAPNESQLPPSAYRFGSFPRVECEPSALWNTRSLLRVRYEGGVKRENDGSGVSMLSSFSLSCFLDALSLDLGISKKNSSPPCGDHGLSGRRRRRRKRRKQPTTSAAAAAGAAAIPLVRGPLASASPSCCCCCRRRRCRCLCSRTATTAALQRRHQQRFRHALGAAPGPRRGPILRRPDRHAAGARAGPPRARGWAQGRRGDGRCRRRRCCEGALLPPQPGRDSAGRRGRRNNSNNSISASASASTATAAEERRLHQPKAVPPHPRPARGAGARGRKGGGRAQEQGRLHARFEARGSAEEAAGARQISSQGRERERERWYWWKRRRGRRERQQRSELRN